jgi:hypothetical protein
LDEQWKRKRKDFPDAAKKKGVYVLYSEKPRDILYVGKTGGETMDFATRLYRHATISGSQDSRVYKELKKVNDRRKRIHAALIDVSWIRTFFSEKELSTSGYIDIFEQIAIRFLRPRLQRDKE